jgi:DNA helicase-2/ATP-dependent DNA helicase PcrA
MLSLNPQQREAVETIEGPILILAGAGSGKTRAITCRIVYLIEQVGVPSERILAITFTNKAAEEMRSRVEAMLGSRPGACLPVISTFHSLCVRMLRRNIELMDAGYTRNFTIYDESDQAQLVRQIMKDINLDSGGPGPAQQVLSAISWAKSRGFTPAAYLNMVEHVSDRVEKIARIYKLYEQRLHQANALDFDDLLIKAVELLRRVPEVRSHYHQRFCHLMIDEFQDTNGIQYELARLIVTDSTQVGESKLLWDGRSLCVCGDIDQAIYGFRGSDFNIILGFQHDFKGTKIIKLEQNYRSTQTILDAANRLIENNRKRLPKVLYATDRLGRGEKIRYYQSYDGDGEAAFVAEKIHEHLRRSPSERCAILYRTNAQSRLFEEALRRRGIAYVMVGGFSFYERAEIKDCLAYLKLALNPHDDVALARIINSPPRGIGKGTLDALYQKQRDLGVSLWETIEIVLEQSLLPRTSSALRGLKQLITSLGECARSYQRLAETVKAVILDTGYAQWLQEEGSVQAESRLLNIEELVSAAVEAEARGETLSEFIDRAALVSDTDQYRADAQVSLMTIHSAKGLEFPVVFIVGMEEGLFPHKRATWKQEEVEEERRLCYVAMTRAQRYLYLTHAMRRRTFGEESPVAPSRFLSEIPVELIEDLSLGPSWLKFSSLGTLGDQCSSKTDGARDFLEYRLQQGLSETGFMGRLGQVQPRSFRVGSRVRHPKYGSGVVLQIEGAGDDTKLTVSFPGFGQKKFIAKFAALEEA